MILCLQTNSQTELDKLTTSEFNDIRSVLTDLKDAFTSATAEVASLNASIASIDGSRYRAGQLDAS